MTEREKNAILGIKYVAGKMEKEGITSQNADELFICLRELLSNPIMSIRFLKLVRDLSYLPEVEQEARKHTFGGTGLKVFRWIVDGIIKSYSERVG